MVSLDRVMATESLSRMSKALVYLMFSLMLMSCGIGGDWIEINFEVSDFESIAHVDLRAEHYFNEVCFPLKKDKSVSELKASLKVRLIDTEGVEQLLNSVGELRKRRENYLCYHFSKEVNEIKKIKRVLVSHSADYAVSRAYWVSYDK